MRIITLSLLLLSLFSSCQEKRTPEQEAIDTIESLVKKRVIKDEFKTILDSAGVSGAIVIHDLTKDSLYSNNFAKAREGYLPASTFKITNSIIGLEMGILDIDTTLFRWDGKKRMFPIWEQDLNLEDAFHKSCLPCYQELSIQIGVDSMQYYLDKLDYMEYSIDSSNLSNFWIKGDAKVTALTQMDFLQRFYQKSLPISKSTQETMQKMMVIQSTKDYKLSGKTGWATTNNTDLGWFIGHIETKNHTYVFATNIKPRSDFNMDLFLETRKQVVFDALRVLGVDVRL